MIGLIGEPERKGRLAKTFGEVLFECLLEAGDLMPLAWFLCVAALSIIGAMVYQSMLDPNTVEIASRLDTLSIDPDKWFPR
jgi:hypothetical protein